MSMSLPRAPSVHGGAPLMTPSVRATHSDDDQTPRPRHHADPRSGRPTSGDESEEAEEEAEGDVHLPAANSIRVSEATSRRGSARSRRGDGGDASGAPGHRSQGSGLSSLALRTASTPAATRVAAALAAESIEAVATRARELGQTQQQEEQQADPESESAGQRQRVLSFADERAAAGSPSVEPAIDSPIHSTPLIRELAPVRRPVRAASARVSRGSSSRWAANHEHLLANLSSLRDEIANWEEEAFARIKAAENELAASKATEAATAEAKETAAREAAESRLFFFNEFAARRADNIRQGGDGETPLAATSGDAAGGVGGALAGATLTGRRSTWNASEAAAKAAAALGLASSANPRRSTLHTGEASGRTLSALDTDLSARGQGQGHVRVRSREQDVRALADLERVMNTDRDEEWMQTILDLASPQAKRTMSRRDQQAGTGSADPVPSPSRSGGRPVSKVYSTLALEHRRALRRHPKIGKWLAKFWRVFFPKQTGDTAAAASRTTEEKEKEEGKSPTAAASSMTAAAAPSDSKSNEPSPTTTSGLAPALSPSPSSSSQSHPSEADGLSKSEFLRFYSLVHKVLSGDDADLASSATHDWERMVGLKRRMDAHQFGDILFELVDLWCLTHIPEDYVSILKALYCRCTTRDYSPAAGCMVTAWVDPRWVGLGPQFKVKPILGAPNAAEEAKKAARRAKQRQFERIMAQQEREDKRKAAVAAALAAGKPPPRSFDESDSDSEALSLEDVSSASDNSDLDALQSDEEQPDEDEPQSDQARRLQSAPLVDENGQLLSLNSAQVRHQNNRLRARETQYVNEAVLALNESVSSFHDRSNLVLRAAKMGDTAVGPAGSPSASDDTGFVSIHSGSGMGYAARRKTIGLKWSIVSELMEGEIGRAKAERDEIERMRRDLRRQVDTATQGQSQGDGNEAAPPVHDSTQTDSSSPSSSAVGKLDFGRSRSNLNPKRASLNLDGMVLGISGRTPRKNSIGGLVSADLSPSTGGGRQRPTSVNLSASFSPRHLYAAFDEGDSDLEDEEDARAARQARKERVGHSWPSLQRVLSMARKVKGIQGSWMELVSSALARKRKAEALDAQARLLKHFKRTRAAAERQARIAGMSLKTDLDLSDLPMLEQLAALNFVRGGASAAEKIAAMVHEREEQRKEEQKERQRAEKEIERKRAERAAAVRAAARARRGEPPEPQPQAVPPATAAQPSGRRGSLTAGTGTPPVPNPRRISWRDEHKQQILKSADIAAAAAGAAAAANAPAPAHPLGDDSATRRSQRRATQDAVTLRLAGGGARMGPPCLNPLHTHGPRLIKMGVTEIGSKFPLEDPNYFGEGECVFSPTALAAATAAAAGSAVTSPANASAESDTSVLSTHQSEALHSVLQAQLEASLAPAPPPAPFSVQGGHMHIAPRDVAARGLRKNSAASGSNQFPGGVLRGSAASVAAAPRPMDDAYAAPHVHGAGLTGSSISVAAGAAGGRAGPVPSHTRRLTGGSIGALRRRGSSSARTSSPTGEGAEAGVSPTAPMGVPLAVPLGRARSTSSASSGVAPGSPVRAQHTRQRSRSAVASPMRNVASTGALQQHDHPQVQRVASDASQARMSLRSYTSAPAVDGPAPDPARVYLPSVGPTGGTGGNRRVLSASSSRTGSPGRVTSARPPAVPVPIHASSTHSQSVKQHSFGLVPMGGLTKANSSGSGGSAATFLASHSHAGHASGSPPTDASYPHAVLFGRSGGVSTTAGSSSTPVSLGSSPVMRGVGGSHPPPMQMQLGGSTHLPTRALHRPPVGSGASVSASALAARPLQARGKDEDFNFSYDPFNQPR